MGKIHDIWHPNDVTPTQNDQNQPISSAKASNIALMLIIQWCNAHAQTFGICLPEGSQNNSQYTLIGIRMTSHHLTQNEWRHTYSQNEQSQHISSTKALNADVIMTLEGGHYALYILLILLKCYRSNQSIISATIHDPLLLYLVFI